MFRIIMVLFTIGAMAHESQAATPAKQLFGKAKTPAIYQPESFGTYNKGCLAGGEQMPVNGAAWQAMRLKRNRNWGHPILVEYLKKLAIDVRNKDGWPGLLVGDLSQPRGGPMLTGHASHQVGLDADIWLLPMPEKTLSDKERETISAVSMLKNRSAVNPKIWTDAHFRLIRRAAKDKRVARIFVHPAIKKALCDAAGKDRNWLRTIRPWRGHHYHFHVRMKCPKGDNGCRNQAAPPKGDGCGKPLQWWLYDRFKVKKVKKPKKKYKPKPPLVLADLPPRCASVLKAK